MGAGLTCRACVIACIDFRLHDLLTRFLRDRTLDRGGADLIRIAGAIKNIARPDEPRDRDLLLNQMKISKDLHQVKEIYLLNHEDCGAYGLEAVEDSTVEIDTHREDLRAAAKLVRAALPQVEVRSYFLWLDGRAEPVD